MFAGCRLGLLEQPIAKGPGSKISHQFVAIDFGVDIEIRCTQQTVLCIDAVESLHRHKRKPCIGIVKDALKPIHIPAVRSSDREVKPVGRFQIVSVSVTGILNDEMLAGVFAVIGLYARPFCREVQHIARVAVPQHELLSPGWRIERACLLKCRGKIYIHQYVIIGHRGFKATRFGNKLTQQCNVVDTVKERRIIYLPIAQRQQKLLGLDNCSVEHILDLIGDIIGYQFFGDNAPLSIVADSVPVIVIIADNGVTLVTPSTLVVYYKIGTYIDYIIVSVLVHNNKIP